MFGRVPFAFYVAHFYPDSRAQRDARTRARFRAEPDADDLPVLSAGLRRQLASVYLVWLFVVVWLYPCADGWHQGAAARLVAEFRLRREAPLSPFLLSIGRTHVPGRVQNVSKTEGRSGDSSEHQWTFTRL